MTDDLTVTGLVSLYRIQEKLPSFSNARNTLIGFVEHVRKLTAPNKTIDEILPIVAAARNALKFLSDELQRYDETEFCNYPFLLRIKNLNHQDGNELFKIINNTKNIVRSLVIGSDKPVQVILDETIKAQNETDSIYDPD